MGRNAELYSLFESHAQAFIPHLSGGQLYALSQLAEIAPTIVGRPILIEAIEGMGGAGKTEVFTAIQPMLSEMGIAFISDELPPDVFRETTGFGGPIIKTGRMFGASENPDYIIRVPGFSVSEIDQHLSTTVLKPSLRIEIAKRSLGSMRVAQLMSDHIASLPTDAPDSAIRSYLNRLAASFLYDRIPNFMLENGLEYIQFILTDLFNQYIPDRDLESEKLQIGYELYELSSKEFPHLYSMLEALGCDPSVHNGDVNPVQIITSLLEQNGFTRYLHSDALSRVSDTIERIQRTIQPGKNSELRVSMPLYTYRQTRPILEQIVTSSLDGTNGLHREPRFYIAAAIPMGDQLHILLENCLDTCIRNPLQSTMRKTALATFPNPKARGERRAGYVISHDTQFFSTEYGHETHKFFTRPFPELEIRLDRVAPKTDRLFFLSGDHTKIPRVPTMIIDLALESILQQLDIPYIVQYINKTFHYDPKGRTLQSI